MHTLQTHRLPRLLIPVSTSWLLGECMEARGKQDLWTRQRPEVLAALREQAVIQSVESSNRIEGVTIPSERLRPVVLGNSKPRDRSEEELAGYRKALDWIFTRKPELRLEPKVILHLHALAQGGASGDAGRWKQRDNEIVEFTATGERRIRFRPTSARQTPTAIQSLCDAWQTMLDDATIPPLLLTASVVLDFLCIHPFRDGNGRVSRLLTTLLLLQQGFEVGRYVSLERIVEDTKEDYYRVLQACSNGWHDGLNDGVLWWNYFLGHLRRAYLDFASQVESAGNRPAKSEMVRQAISAQVGPFSQADIRAQVPGVSVQQIKKVLSEMKKRKQVRLVGRGRGARWEVIADAR